MVTLLHSVQQDLGHVPGLSSTSSRFLQQATGRRSASGCRACGHVGKESDVTIQT